MAPRFTSSPLGDVVDHLTPAYGLLLLSHLPTNVAVLLCLFSLLSTHGKFYIDLTSLY